MIFIVKIALFCHNGSMQTKYTKIEILERPRLVNRPTCKTFKLEGGCWDCGHTKFRYYNSVFGKKYYQCEKCRAINH